MRFFLGIVLCFQVTFALEFVYPDFKQCYEKNKNSFVYFDNLRAIAVDAHRAVAYSKTKPTHPYIKHDPFLNLYLFESKKPLKPVKLKDTKYLKIGEWIAGADERSLYAGNLAQMGDIMDSFYLQNAKLDANSMVLCLCCEVYGLGTGGGTFIGSEYIKRFLTQTNPFYGDIGVLFEQKGQNFYIKQLNPLHAGEELRLGDELVKIDGKKPSSLKTLNQYILFAKEKQKIKLEILRDNAPLNCELQVFSRFGGDSVSDPFLEKKGIFLNQSLVIVKITKDSFGDTSGLKIGDKLLQINGLDINDTAKLKHFLTTTKMKTVQMLFERNNFQFFIKLLLTK
ncbi:MAG: PDZ domain-containing protein [Sulfurospirillum sp.]|nr:PDZ domain-containing protein [Sulfurospirillum sp.]